MTPAARGLIVPAIATVVVTGILAGLGTWQVQRLAWKNDLIATIVERTRRPPIPAPSLAEARRLDLDAVDFQPVTVEGRYLAGVEARVHAVLGEAHGPRSGPGVWVMTPLERADGSLVWVNRGFVPSGPGGPVAYAPPSNEPVTLTGILRRPEPRGSYTPADDLAHHLWFVRDAAVLAAGTGLDAARVAPFTVDADRTTTPPGGLPQAGETRMTYPNDHLGYAITWYGLALTCVGVFAAFARGRMRRGNQPRRAE